MSGADKAQRHFNARQQGERFAAGDRTKGHPGPADDFVLALAEPVAKGVKIAVCQVYQVYEAPPFVFSRCCSEQKAFLP